MASATNNPNVAASSAVPTAEEDSLARFGAPPQPAFEGPAMAPVDQEAVEERNRIWMEDIMDIAYPEGQPRYRTPQPTTAAAPTPRPVPPTPVVYEPQIRQMYGLVREQVEKMDGEWTRKKRMVWKDAPSFTDVITSFQKGLQLLLWDHDKLRLARQNMAQSSQPEAPSTPPPAEQEPMDTDAPTPQPPTPEVPIRRPIKRELEDDDSEAPPARRMRFDSSSTLPPPPPTMHDDSQGPESPLLADAAPFPFQHPRPVASRTSINRQGYRPPLHRPIRGYELAAQRSRVQQHRARLHQTSGGIRRSTRTRNLVDRLQVGLLNGPGGKGYLSLQR